MSGTKSFLSDNETALDLLNNEAIATTIIELIREQPDKPITIGVHGDWGAGKSSILEMIDAGLDGEGEVLCVKFNGWRYQGFEDAKIALIEGIVTGLLERRPALAKAADKVRAVMKRIDWLKVAKRGGGLALTALTGIPDPGLIQDVASNAIALFRNPEQASKTVEQTVEELQGLVKGPQDSKNVTEEIREFRRAFDELLEEAKVSRLVVLVDDLDRCLPDTAIETLEAIRLFVFSPKTAFVVAADEAMIEYSVRRHFPDLPYSTGPQAYTRSYLEKLIQVPFRIPALGEGETRLYVALALAEVRLGAESPEFQALLAHARDVLKRPWLGCILLEQNVGAALGNRAAEASDILVLSDQIGPILARGTRGNPRQVKRFLNALLLRLRIASSRGFGEDIEMPTLAKLMLAEQFSPPLFEVIGVEASKQANGFSGTLSALEEAQPRQDRSAKKPGGKAGEAQKDGETLVDPALLESPWVQEWAKLDPKLGSTDLRPYLFVSNQQPRASARGSDSILTLVEYLMGPEMGFLDKGPELRSLPEGAALGLFQELAGRCRGSNLAERPPGADGLRFLVQERTELQTELLAFLRSLPVEHLGPWVTSGWDSALGTHKAAFSELLVTWAGQTVNKPLALTAKSVGGVRK